MNAPKIIATVLAATPKSGRTPYLSVFITGGLNICVNGNDPAYSYIKKGMEITFSYEKISVGEYPDGKPFVKVSDVEILGLQEAVSTPANNPFAHLTVREAPAYQHRQSEEIAEV